MEAIVERDHLRFCFASSILRVRWANERRSAMLNTSGRLHLEMLLQQRQLDGTLAGRVPTMGRLATGLPPLDAQLEGGVPRGHVSEVVGPRSSGRSRLLLTVLAATTRQGEVAAWIDTVDRGDPAAAAAGGVCLSHVLWIRGMALSPGELALRPGRDAADDLVDLCVRRALKAVALVVQAGGFGLVALDLCDIPPAALRQVPASTWVRLHRLVEGRETALVLLAGAPVTRSAGGVSVRLQGRPRWEGETPRMRRLEAIDCALQVVSSRQAPACGRAVDVALAG